MSASPAVTEARMGVVTALLTRLTPRQSLYAGAVCLIATVVAYVVMTARGDDTTGLLVLAVPIIGLLFQQGGTRAITNDQNAVLDDQMRGLVTELLEDVVPRVVHDVLSSRGVAVPAPRAVSRAESLESAG